MRVRRLPNRTIHKPGIRLMQVLPLSGQAANDIPQDAIASMLERNIRYQFERAPKRRSRGPYVLGPISEAEKRESPISGTWYGYTFPQNMVAYIVGAEVLKV